MFLDFLANVLYLRVAQQYLAVLAYEEEGGEYFDIVQLCRDSECVMHASPWQVGSRLLPEILVLVERYLVDVESLISVFVVQFAHENIAAAHLCAFVECEVEHHHLAYE